jgi:hypothetical protein
MWRCSMKVCASRAIIYYYCFIVFVLQFASFIQEYKSCTSNFENDAEIFEEINTRLGHGPIPMSSDGECWYFDKNYTLSVYSINI